MKEQKEGWYYTLENNTFGPYSFEEIKQLILSEKINESTMLFNYSTNKWEPAIVVLNELLAAKKQIPPPAHSVEPQTPPPIPTPSNNNSNKVDYSEIIKIYGSIILEKCKFQTGLIKSWFLKLGYRYQISLILVSLLLIFTGSILFLLKGKAKNIDYSRVQEIRKNSKLEEIKQEKSKNNFVKDEKQNDSKPSKFYKPDSKMASVQKSMEQYSLAFNPNNDPKVKNIKKDTSFDIKAKNFYLTSDYLPKSFKPRFYGYPAQNLFPKKNQDFYYCDEQTGDLLTKEVKKGAGRLPPVIIKRTETKDLITLSNGIEIKLNAKLGDKWTSNGKTYKVVCFGSIDQINGPVLDPQTNIPLTDSRTGNTKAEKTNGPESFCIIDCQEKNKEGYQFVCITNYGLWAILKKEIKYFAVSNVLFSEEYYGKPSDYPYFVDLMIDWIKDDRLAEAKAKYEEGLSKEERILARIEEEIDKIELEMDNYDDDSPKYKSLERKLLELEKKQAIYEIAVSEEISYAQAAKIASQGEKSTLKDLDYIMKNKKVPPNK
jgi:hypothetical protein